MSDIQIQLSAVRKASDTGGVVDIEDEEKGRTEEIKAGKSKVGVGYRLRFDATGPQDGQGEWIVKTGQLRKAIFKLEQADEDGEPEWVVTGRGPFHGGNHAAGRRTGGTGFVLVVTEGRGVQFTVRYKHGKSKSNLLGPFLLGIPSKG